MRKLFLVSLLILVSVSLGLGQRNIIHLPDLPGYITLKCDFHLHTIFSDGNVWPTFRVGEAYMDGLDAIAITDHLEYLPKKDYIPSDFNAAWKIAQGPAQEGNIILVHGAEITRKMPPGHLNALFITDASALVKDSVFDVVGEAVKQGAFIFWNHPGWKSQQPDGIPRMYEIHKRLLKNNWINGIEFSNGDEYYPLVLTWCRDNNLTVMGNSDSHGILSQEYAPPQFSHRPMTLVFARERTSDALKEALFARRTLVWEGDILAGSQEYARPFFFRSVAIAKPFFRNDKNLYFEISNNSDIPFSLVNGPSGAPASISLPANTVTRVVLSNKFTGQLIYDVRNVMTGENEVLKVELVLPK